MRDLVELEKKINIKFNNIDLLHQAMIHRSYLNEHYNCHLGHNERLEFLGDAVLELVTTEYLYKNYPNPEGELTNFRAALVNSEMLAKIGKMIGLDLYLFMSKGERKDTGRARQYLLANAFEALIGAIYLDQGYKVVKNFIGKNLLGEINKIIEQELYKDPKSNFQEKAQEKTKITPIYKILKEHGPDHNKHFVVGVYLKDEIVGRGEGPSKQEAQRQASIDALKNKEW